MSTFAPAFQQILDEELAGYKKLVLEMLADQLRAKGLVLTEDLLQSLQGETTAASERFVADMAVSFNEYGRMKEMKRLNYTKGAPVEQIEAFVRKRGLARFERVPGYKPGQFPLSQDVAINRIAWGLSRARLRDAGKHKPKGWYAKTFYRSLNRFIDAVTTRYAAQAGVHVAGAIKF
ncbi:hypothetical protein GCM10027048_20510 [Hymenobacter coalescens]